MRRPRWLAFLLLAACARSAAAPGAVATPAETTDPINLFVIATGGTDGWDCTQPNRACATMAGALSHVPRVVNHPVVINLGPGTYPELLILTGYTINPLAPGAGSITFLGPAPTQATLTTGAATGAVTSAAQVLNGAATALTISGAGFTSADMEGKWLVLQNNPDFGPTPVPIYTNTSTTITTPVTVFVDDGATYQIVSFSGGAVLTGGMNVSNIATDDSLSVPPITFQNFTMAPGAGGFSTVQLSGGGAVNFNTCAFDLTNAGDSTAVFSAGGRSNALGVTGSTFNIAGNGQVAWYNAGAINSLLNVSNSAFRQPPSATTTGSTFRLGADHLNLSASSFKGRMAAVLGANEGAVVVTSGNIINCVSATGTTYVSLDLAAPTASHYQVWSSTDYVTTCGVAFNATGLGTITFTGGTPFGASNTTVYRATAGGKIQTQSGDSITGSSYATVNATTVTKSALEGLSGKRKTDTSDLSTIWEQ